MMDQTCGRRPFRLALEIPVIVLVLGFTAIPLGLRSPDVEAISQLWEWKLDVVDLLTNIVAYVPLGFLAAHRGRGTAVRLAFGVSLTAELMQEVSIGRYPSLIDLAANVLGAIVGTALPGARRREVLAIGIDRPRALVAGSLALALIGISTVATPRDIEYRLNALLAAPPSRWDEVNARGASVPGRLEAHWTLDGSQGDAVLDDSGHGLAGELIHDPGFVSGVFGRALKLDGRQQSVDVGDPLALRLTGSMTISAWIRASTFPPDDAAIVSNRSRDELGYQLDTTVDQGPRTIGFKLSDASGRIMARYGRTPLRPERWYHVAGVYDADAQTLNVYLDGRLDNGCLLGRVTRRQYRSGVHTFLGRRGSDGFEFAGALDDVRIYSTALSPEAVRRLAARPDDHAGSGPSAVGVAAGGCMGACADSTTAGLPVLLGILVGVAVIGARPARKAYWVTLVLSLGAGVLLVWQQDVAQPPLFWLVGPLLAVIGGATAARSMTLRSP